MDFLEVFRECSDKLARPPSKPEIVQGFENEKKTALFEALFAVNSTVQQNGCIVNLKKAMKTLSPRSDHS